MNRVFALATTIPKTCSRSLSVTQIKCVKPDLTRIKKKQMHFQMNDDIPVYLKGGPMDYVLFYITVGLVVIGTASSIHSLYKLTSGKQI